MAKQTVRLPVVVLDWSNWVAWTELAKDARVPEGVKVPNERPSVNEVWRKNSRQQLTIGKASDLRVRIKQALIRGKSAHSAGGQIRRKERLKNLEVRWAITDRPAAVEEHLHVLYRKKFKTLPKYVRHT